MAGKSTFLEQKWLNRMFRRTTTTVDGTNASVSNIKVTSSTGFDVGDIVKFGVDSLYRWVTAIPDATHITITPSFGSAPVTGNVEAWGYCPAAVYIALFTVAPTDAGGGTEVSGGSYVRQQVIQADTTWSTPGTLFPGSIIIAPATFTFPTPTANWGGINAIGLVDTPSGAFHLLYWNPLSPAIVVNSGDPAPDIAASSLTIEED